MSASSSFRKALGPGLLFAGTAVGVSHLVQSTRAGAVYGLGLVVFILLANLLKYPAFAFAPRYAAATGASLVEAYRQQGRWAVVLYALVTAGTMFAVQAAVVIVTAGLAQALFGDALSVLGYAVALTLITALLNGVGSFAVLDRVIKAVVLLLSIATLAATVAVIPSIAWSTIPWLTTPGSMAPADVFFLAALVGWMPTALDIGVWHSLWTLARREQTGHAPTVREVALDFDIGYIGTAVLALCFVLLGAGVMYGKGVAIAESPGGFASQVIALYTENLGAWTRPIIATAAFGVMFSTVLTVVDGFPRAIQRLVDSLRGAVKGPLIPRDAEALAPPPQAGGRGVYFAALAVLGGGSLVLLAFFSGSLKGLVDLATTLSFLTAPVFAILNHRAVTSRGMPLECRPSRALRRFSAIGILFQAIFALAYLWVRFLSG
ncbi:MAG: divalent metal cation transporter [Nannocystaceae bacterium]